MSILTVNNSDINDDLTRLNNEEQSNSDDKKLYTTGTPISCDK